MLRAFGYIVDAYCLGSCSMIENRTWKRMEFASYDQNYGNKQKRTVGVFVNIFTRSVYKHTSFL
jgi:hypothetical protein